MRRPFCRLNFGLFFSAGLLLCAAPVHAGDNYALLIAVGDYDLKELRPLKFTRPDIVEFQQALVESGFNQKNIVLMHDDLEKLVGYYKTLGVDFKPRDYLPETAKIRRELDLMLGRLRSDDSVIVAFSGHGINFKSDKKSYFCPADAKLDDKHTLIGFEEVYVALKECSAGRKLLLIDACQNDPLSEIARSRATVELDSVTRPPTDAVPEGIIALFSCKVGQKSFELPELGHGLFFYHLIDGWKGNADRNGDGKITYKELAEHTETKTAEFAALRLKVLQTPLLRTDFSGDWILRELPKTRVPPPLFDGTRPPQNLRPREITISNRDRAASVTLQLDRESGKQIEQLAAGQSLQRVVDQGVTFWNGKAWVHTPIADSGAVDFSIKRVADAGIWKPSLRLSTSAVEAGAAAAQKAWATYLKIPVEFENSLGMKLRLIPPGEYKRGSTRADVDGIMEGVSTFKREDANSEQPQHTVRLTTPFFFCVTEVTRSQFAQFIAASGHLTDAESGQYEVWGWNASTGNFEKRSDNWRNPGFAQSDDHPVVNVSWNDAVAFCEWLSKKEGVVYRLPTEAEWEYACRAGTQTNYQSGDDPEMLAGAGNVADGTANGKFSSSGAINTRDGFIFTSPVGKFRANGFGLLDMHGNAWEWCADWYDANEYARIAVRTAVDPRGPRSGTYQVMRGGGFANLSATCRSANRGNNNPRHSRNDLGFRVAAVPSTK